jgi:hypothetical protein
MTTCEGMTSAAGVRVLQPRMSAAAAKDSGHQRDRMEDMRSCAVVLSLCALAVALSGCGGDRTTAFRDRETGLTLRYPRSWTVTGFSQTTSPRRLVAASYHVVADEVEGDCGGRRALRPLSPRGAAVLLIDYGSTTGFAPHPRDFTLTELRRATYECFGDTYMVQFSRGGHNLQAHVAIGRRASAERRQEALSILDSLEG